MSYVPEAMQHHYESALHCVGREETVSLGTVTAKHFKHFAQACGDLNPLYYDERFAQAHGYPGLTAPPIFLSGVLGWEAGPPESELRPDGLCDSDLAFIKLPGARLMGGGQELEFIAPVRDGDQVAVHRMVAGVERRTSKSGEMVLLKLEKRYFNQDGQTLVICRETMIVR